MRAEVERANQRTRRQCEAYENSREIVEKLHEPSNTQSRLVMDKMGMIGWVLEETRRSLVCGIFDLKKG